MHESTPIFLSQAEISNNQIELEMPRQKELIIAGDKGPCIGVNMALDTTTEVLSLVGGKELVYANHDPVHNEPILQEYLKRGLRIEPDVDKIPPGSIYIFSAHGALPSEVKKAEKLNLLPVNVECTYVTTDRRQIERAIKDGFHVIFLGSKPRNNETKIPSWHPEPLATLGDFNPNNYSLINVKSESELDEDEIDNLDDKIEDIPLNKPIKAFSQTTLSTQQIERKKEEIEKIIGRSLGKIEGICYATDNRQTAVREGIFGNPDNYPDKLIVIGSKTSNNTNELVKIGWENIGTKNTYQIDTADELQDAWIENAIRIGLTSGASVLDRYTEPVINWFRIRDYFIRLLPSTENQSATLRRPDLTHVKTYLEQKYYV